MADPAPNLPDRLSPYRADRLRASADSDLLTADAGYELGPPAGWPWAPLLDTAPSVDDRQSAATADDFLPQVLALTPRGAAWGTDEVGDGAGASPQLRRFWRAIAAWVADLNTRDFAAAIQAFPSAVTWSLPDWEAEYALPDPCAPGDGSVEARIAAIRSRFGAVGAQSPAYFECLAASIGYDITIEEPTQFLVDVSVVGQDPVETWFCIDDGEIDGDPLEGLVLAADMDLDELAGEGVTETWFEIDDGEIDDTPLEGAGPEVPTGTVWKYWIVRVASGEFTWFEIDDGEIDFTPLEGFEPHGDLECLLRRACPPHTHLIFDYGGLGTPDA